MMRSQAGLWNLEWMKKKTDSSTSHPPQPMFTIPSVPQCPSPDVVPRSSTPSVGLWNLELLEKKSHSSTSSSPQPRFMNPAVPHDPSPEVIPRSSIPSRIGLWNLVPNAEKVLNHLGGAPLSALPREGHRKWGSLPVTEITKQHTEELLIAGRPGISGMLSIHRAYEKWKASRLQKILSCGETLALFGGYLHESGLKASTCSTYVYSALFFEKRLLHPHDPQWFLAYDIIRALNRQACYEEREHAYDTTEEDVIKMLDVIRNHEVTFAIWAMSTCGARAADLLRLGESGGSFQVFGKHVKVHFKITKNHTEQSEQYSLTLPILIPFRKEWSELAARPSPFTVSAQKINDTLHAAGFKETSYSFRRLFINQVIERLTENGVTQWMKVIELTGHKQVKMVKGLYKAH